MNTQEELQLVAESLADVLAGKELDADTLYALTNVKSDEAYEAILNAAEKITAAFAPRKFDSCSIVNARSGRCSENCKWCAQSAHFPTGCATYEVIPAEEALSVARYNRERGVGRFSLVASGRKVTGKALEQMCRILRDVKEKEGIYTCASMGLLSAEELQMLWDNGVRRYHCNLETAPSYFEQLCTSHTIEDKISTILAAKAIGFEVCSGGIIGMGESRRQRMELAIELRRVQPHSIPINVLSPIAGTPLENTEPISEKEILLTYALYRFAHPRTQIRFAGGRARLSKETALRALKVAANGGIVGDLLTTIGSTIDEDKALVTAAGYEF